MTPFKASRAALYARVSLDDQAKHGHSIDGQIDAMQKYCELHRYEVYDIYVDAGLSGTTINGRTELQRMLEDGNANRFDILVIWRISRLSRDLSDLLEMVQTLKRNNISLHSVADHFDSDSDYGNFTLQIMGAAAQLERDYIADNAKAGSIERSRQGIWNGGNNVPGYRWVRNPEDHKGYVEVVPEEAQTVLRIFELYATGNCGFKSIAVRLNNENLKSKNGKPFSATAVRGILINQNYIGRIRFNVSEHRRSKGTVPLEWAKGEHVSIVSTELWQKVQAVLASRTKAPKRTITRSFPLTGLLKCPQCGKSMIPGHVKKTRKNGSLRTNYYYLCGSINAGRPCKANLINADKIEDIFFGHLQNLLVSPESIKKIVSAATTKQDMAKQPLMDKLREYNTQLVKLESNQKMLFQSFENDRMTDDELMNSLDTLTNQKQLLEREKTALERALANLATSAYPPEKVTEALQHLRQLLDSQSMESQKKLLRLLVEKITVPPDRNLRGITIYGGPALMHVKIPS